MIPPSPHGLTRWFARADRGRGWAALSGAGFLFRDPSLPVLLGAASWADCTVAQAIPIGDHCCYVGEVLDLNLAHDDAAAPLAYYRGRFRALGPAVAPATWMAVETADLTSAC